MLFCLFKLLPTLYGLQILVIGQTNKQINSLRKHFLSTQQIRSITNMYARHVNVCGRTYYTLITQLIYSFCSSKQAGVLTQEAFLYLVQITFLYHIMEHGVLIYFHVMLASLHKKPYIEF